MTIEQELLSYKERIIEYLKTHSAEAVVVKVDGVDGSGITDLVKYATRGVVDEDIKIPVELNKLLVLGLYYEGGHVENLLAAVERPGFLSEDILAAPLRLLTDTAANQYGLAPVTLGDLEAIDSGLGSNMLETQANALAVATYRDALEWYGYTNLTAIDIVTNQLGMLPKMNKFIASIYKAVESYHESLDEYASHSPLDIFFTPYNSNIWELELLESIVTAKDSYEAVKNYCHKIGTEIDASTLEEKLHGSTVATRAISKYSGGDNHATGNLEVTTNPPEPDMVEKISAHAVPAILLGATSVYLKGARDTDAIVGQEYYGELITIRVDCDTLPDKEFVAVKEIHLAGADSPMFTLNTEIEEATIAEEAAGLFTIPYTQMYIGALREQGKTISRPELIKRPTVGSTIRVINRRGCTEYEVV